MVWMREVVEYSELAQLVWMCEVMYEVVEVVVWGDATRWYACAMVEWVERCNVYEVDDCMRWLIEHGT